MHMLALLFFPAIMAWAAAPDLLTMRITNKLVLTLLAGFAVLAPLAAMPLQTLYGHVPAAGHVPVVAVSRLALAWLWVGRATVSAAPSSWLG